jgi:hypothetical protein
MLIQLKSLPFGHLPKAWMWVEMGLRPNGPWELTQGLIWVVLSFLFVNHRKPPCLNRPRRRPSSFVLRPRSWFLVFQEIGPRTKALPSLRSYGAAGEEEDDYDVENAANRELSLVQPG